MDITYEMNMIEQMLDEANEYGLLTEVVLYSLKAMKEDPKISEFDAIVFGYNEWVK